MADRTARTGGQHCTDPGPSRKIAARIAVCRSVAMLETTTREETAHP